MANTSEQITNYPSSVDRRACSRQPLRSLSYVELDEGNGGIVLNVSEGGLSVQAVMRVMDNSLPHMRFQLSRSKDWIEASARVAWTSTSGKVVGLQFVDLQQQSRESIREWLSAEAVHAEGASYTEAGQTVVEGTGGAAVSPRGTNTQTSGPVAASMPEIASAASKEAPSPASTPSPADPASALIRLFGRFDASPEGTLESREGQFESLSIETPHSRRLWVFTGLVAALAIISLVAGWAAGRGAMSDFLARIRGTPRVNTGAESASVASSPDGTISEIEIVDASNRRWTVPFGSAESAPFNENLRRQVSPQHESRPFETPSSAPEIRPEPATNEDQVAPPAAPSPSLNAGSVLPPPASTDSRNLSPSNSESLAQSQAGILERGNLIYHVDPAYPQIAIQEKVEGTVKLRAMIGTDGAVRNVFVISGPELLVEAARNAVRQWRYNPTLLDGKPIESEDYVSIEFRLPRPSN